VETYRTAIELKTVDVSQRIISGFAAVHHSVDRVRDIIDPGASAKAVARLASPQDVGVFIGHDMSALPVGIPLRIEATPHGLYTETYILKGPVGDNLLAVAKDLAAHGRPLGMSIGYRTRDSRHETAGRKRVRRILDYGLHEYSYAAHQSVAHPEAVLTGVKAHRRNEAEPAPPKKALGEGTDTAGGALVPADRPARAGRGGKMDYRVQQEGDQWCVYCAGDDGDGDGDGDLLGRYDDEETANAVADALREADRRTAMMDDGAAVQTDMPAKTAPAPAQRKAVWSTARINDLPDSSFLYIEPDAEKDEDGKTIPRGKRHFPYKNADGGIDLPHLRNAIARIPQSNAPGLDDAKKKALQARARRLLGDAQGNGKTILEEDEWKTGAPIQIYGLGLDLCDLSARLARELKAMALLGEDTKDHCRVRAPLRAELARVETDLHRLLDWAATIERGEDALALRTRYAYELAGALDL
jgi:HK97 family phage prohead protease